MSLLPTEHMTILDPHEWSTFAVTPLAYKPCLDAFSLGAWWLLINLTPCSSHMLLLRGETHAFRAVSKKVSRGTAKAAWIRQCQWDVACGSPERRKGEGRMGWHRSRIFLITQLPSLPGHFGKSPVVQLQSLWAASELRAGNWLGSMADWECQALLRILQAWFHFYFL